MKTILLTVTLMPLVWLSACRAAPSDTPAKAVDVLDVTPASAANAIEVTYLANEGFMIAGGGRKLLIDALFREGVGGYATLSPATRERMEQARSPFDDVDAVFATHFHADHFDAEAVISHLTRNPQAFFFSTNQAADKLRATSKFDAFKTRVVTALPKEGERFHSGHRSLSVQLLNIHHGRARPVENLGFIVEIAGKQVLHIGDSEAESAVFQKYEMAKDRIDVAFLPFWYFLNDDFKLAVREQIRPRHIVVMHIESDTFINRVRSGSWQKKWMSIKAEFPNAVFFENELEKKTFD
ncbi:MAG TPA: MBL fold metallo-hydrolase [Blastocatellia bacterium]|nr:MBL fold metallo-hydrolase [Blastocatellia bacterium]